MEYGLIVTLAVVVLFLFGTPVVLCLGVWVSATSLLNGNVATLANIGQTTFTGLHKFPLLAMPLFILTGDIILKSGIADAVTRFAKSVLGPIPGSSAITTLFASGVFAAISGSNAATAATVGNIMHKDMCMEGYDPDFSAATCAAGGTVGIIIPPSVLFIVYGVLVSVSVSDLFVGGIIPGILMVVAMALVASFLSIKNGWGKTAPLSGRQALSSAWDAKHALLAIIFALGGIYFGVFSPTEAAAMTVAYLVIVTLLNRSVRVRDIPQVLRGSAEVIGVLGPLIAFSVVMQQQFSFMGIQATVAHGLLALPGNTLTMSAMLAIIFLSGMVLESLPNIIIWAPIFAPIAERLGFDPVHFGVVFMVGIAIGFITPPYGLNLFVVSSITKVSYTTIARRVMVYVGALIAVWLLTVMMPSLSLCLL